MNRRATALRVASAVVAALGLVGLVALWQIEPARADTPVDQITGNGSTASAVTVTWAQGLVGTDNTTVVTPRDPTSAYAFMYPDFQHLSVTVSQTKNLVHQAIRVTWTGGKMTQQPFQTDFLQMMQCYGDANTGPTPEQCEYGSFGLMPAAAINASIGQRTGLRCSGSAPSTTNPPGTVGGGGAGLGCDPGEPDDPTHVAPCPTNSCAADTYSVPFIPVGTTNRIYGATTDYYDQYNTNEMQELTTTADGTGQASFQTLTATQAPGLGCGQLEQNGTPRACWLVIVPRGEYEPNGWKTDGGTGRPGYISESPLGASSWAQRIQIRLNFDPLQPNCPIGSAKERGTIGTQLVARAVFSWQLALNTAANCKTLYGFAATPEATNTTQLSDPGGAGLAFTTIPIGSEATRSGGNPGTLPPLVYAPVTVSGTIFAFNINVGETLVNSVKLTPRLVAKALTQSYRYDLPDVDPEHPGPAWAKNNPNFITADPEFQKLNPGVSQPPGAQAPLAPLLTEDHSAINQAVWAWILSDQAARTWLGGTPDENGMVINPNYKALKLGQLAIDSYPRADPTCFNTGVPGERDPGRCSLDLLPYTNNFDDTSGRLRAAYNPLGASWDPFKTAPDGQPGWWSSGGVEPAGEIFLWGVADTASLASYGLVAADLCDANGEHCVSPNTASVTAALGGAKADSSGLLHVDPATRGPGGYPLVQVSYAAVRTDQDPAALKDFAALINYAAGPGQTPGVDPGQLPHGYLPLPANLRAAAQATAATLLAQAEPTATATTAPAPVTQASTPTAGPPSVAAPPTSAASNAGYTTTQARPEPVAKTTQPTPVGGARWALIAMVVAGVAGAVGGPVLRACFGGRPSPWRRP